MGKRRKIIFDRDFKIEVSKMAIEDNVSVANLGKSYGIVFVAGLMNINHMEKMHLLELENFAQKMQKSKN